MLARAAPVICLTAFLAQLCLSGEQAAALPQWLLRAIETEKKSAHPGSFEEEPAAQIIAGIRLRRCFLWRMERTTDQTATNFRFWPFGDRRRVGIWLVSLVFQMLPPLRVTDKSEFSALKYRNLLDRYMASRGNERHQRALACFRKLHQERVGG
jgi:hypothetical protein